MRSNWEDDKTFDSFKIVDDDDFDLDGQESQLLYKSIPASWNEKRIAQDIEERLRVPVPDGMEDDLEALKWMWVQCTIMTRPPKPEYKEGATGWEKWRYERPKLIELENFYRENHQINRINLMIEYCEDKELAITRYSDNADYVQLMKNIQEILDTPPKPSKTIKFQGFPSMLDEETIMGTFTEFGEVTSLDIIPAESETDPKGISGTVVFADPECTKDAIKQWNGVDMGLGVQLKLEMVPEPEDS